MPSSPCPNILNFRVWASIPFRLPGEPLTGSYVCHSEPWTADRITQPDARAYTNLGPYFTIIHRHVSPSIVPMVHQDAHDTRLALLRLQYLATTHLTQDPPPSHADLAPAPNNAWAATITESQRMQGQTYAVQAIHRQLSGERCDVSYHEGRPFYAPSNLHTRAITGRPRRPVSTPIVLDPLSPPFQPLARLVHTDLSEAAAERQASRRKAQRDAVSASPARMRPLVVLVCHQ